MRAKFKDKEFIYWMLLGVIIACAGVLRFYDLAAINQIVFDEVYFPEYGYNYLIGKEFFHVHPPLYNYLSAASIWIYYHLPWLDKPPLQTLSFQQLAVYSFRWINAVGGTLLCLLVALFARRLTQQRMLALLAAAFVAIDGSLLVDSRFALNNIFLLFFGFLAYACAFKAMAEWRQPHKYLLGAGLALGCLVAVKWNGLGYVLALLALLLGCKIVLLFDRLQAPRLGFSTHKPAPLVPLKTHVILFYLLLVPALTYCLLWIPDRLFNTQHDFAEIHRQILGYHSTLVGADEHPYCSKWYGWPLMERPLSYFFGSRVVELGGEAITYHTAVHLLGNPALYWMSTLAILAMLGQWCWQFSTWLRNGVSSRAWLGTSMLLLGYFANLLPWAMVKRCIFFYHYQSASVFGFLALAWYCAWALRARQKWIKALGLGALLLIFAAFVYWLPLALGIELRAEDFYQRMWFQRWI